MPKAIDLTGNKFGKLKVLERAESSPDGKSIYWLCKCDCGKTAVVRGDALRNQRTSSCGCAPKGRKPKKPRLVHNRANICIDCKKACGGCSWSEVNPDTGKIRFEPVPGWTAEEVPLMLLQSGNGYKKIETTYKITACPEFDPDERENRSDCKELTKEESAWFLADIRRILRRWATEDEVRCVRG